MFEFKFADIGEGIHEGTILQWHVKPGDKVKEGDTLVVVETDKVNAELPSPVDGTVVTLGANEGEVIHVGETVVVIDDGSGAPAPAPVQTAPTQVAPTQQAPVAPATASEVYDFKFADIGEGIHEGTILNWLVKEGDKVKEGDTLVVVETDKVNAELPSPVDGTVLKLGKQEGEVIHVGETVVLLGEEGSALPQAQVSQPADEAPAQKGAGVVGEIEVSDEIIGGSFEETQATTTGKVLASPVARKLAADLGIDLAQVKGTGEQGRILKENIQSFTQGTKPAPAQVHTTQAVAPAQAPQVQFAAPKLPEGDVEVVKISRLRKAISNAMVRSKTMVPHTVLMDEINVDALVEFRSNAKDL